MIITFCNTITAETVANFNPITKEINYIDIGIPHCVGVSGLVKTPSGYYLGCQMDDGKNIIFNYTTKKEILCEKIKDVHDLKYYNGMLFVVSSGNNSLYIIDAEDNECLIKNFDLNAYYDKYHFNCLVYNNREIIISHFGVKKDPTELWRDINNGRIIYVNSGFVIFDKLEHPHSLVYIDGILAFCESRKGIFHYGSAIKNLNCYIRGVTYDENYIYVAYSIKRKYSKSTGLKNKIVENEMINNDRAGILYLNKKTLDVVDCFSFKWDEVYSLSEGEISE